MGTSAGCYLPGQDKTRGEDAPDQIFRRWQDGLGNELRKSLREAKKNAILNLNKKSLFDKVTRSVPKRAKKFAGLRSNSEKDNDFFEMIKRDLGVNRDTGEIVNPKAYLKFILHDVIYKKGPLRTDLPSGHPLSFPLLRENLTRKDTEENLPENFDTQPKLEGLGMVFSLLSPRVKVNEEWGADVAKAYRKLIELYFSNNAEDSMIKAIEDFEIKICPEQLLKPHVALNQAGIFNQCTSDNAVNCPRNKIPGWTTFGGVGEVLVQSPPHKDDLQKAYNNFLVRYLNKVKSDEGFCGNLNSIGENASSENAKMRDGEVGEFCKSQQKPSGTMDISPEKKQPLQIADASKAYTAAVNAGQGDAFDYPTDDYTTEVAQQAPLPKGSKNEDELTIPVKFGPVRKYSSIKDMITARLTNGGGKRRTRRSKGGKRRTRRAVKGGKRKSRRAVKGGKRKTRRLKGGSPYARLG